jgi:hypothetical protein
MLNCSNPKFALIAKPQSSVSDLAVPVANTESMFSRSSTYLKPLLGTELWQVLHDLNQFTDFLTYYRSTEISIGLRESALFQHWDSSLKHRILSYSPLNDDMSMCDDNFKEAICLTAGLWISTGLWTFPLSTSLIASMAVRLFGILQVSEVAVWRARFPEILLWILIIGACCTPMEGPRREFLLNELREMVRLRNFVVMYDLVRAMRCFIYIEGAYAEPLARLWEDILEEGKG